MFIMSDPKGSESKLLSEREEEGREGENIVSMSG